MTTIVYDWNVESLECVPLAGEKPMYVTTAHWKLTGSDGSYEGYIYGMTCFEVDPNKTAYIPFADLTSDEVISWVKNSLGDEQITNYETGIKIQIKNLISPPIITPPLPWSV